MKRCLREVQFSFLPAPPERDAFVAKNWRSNGSMFIVAPDIQHAIEAAESSGREDVVVHQAIRRSNDVVIVEVER